MCAKPLETIGDKYGDFKVTNIMNISELHCQLRELIHSPTGAQVLHIANADPENLFCLSFQTIPSSSNGVAHILEHTVLCGSRKFPVRDPFFCMKRRSLTTFMNAMTGPDFTCYPAASQLPKDFYNLLEVYLDAVFHPLIEQHSFHQEGHRLELSKADDPTSSLEYKGIVYNEMKGSLSNPATRLIEMINQALFPDVTYGVNSGGDPKEIIKLSYQQLRHFHKTHYHPSHCLFFFYGNMPLEGHLDFLLDHALKDVHKAPPLAPLSRQKRFNEPKMIRTHYPIAHDEDPSDKTWIAFAWLTCDILQQDELLALHILESVLLDTDASPLKNALLKSGLCTQVGTYIESDISEAPWIIILQGCKPKSAEQLQTLLFNTLESIQKEGIPDHLIANAFHQLEFFRSEITGGHAPFGLSLFMRSALLKHHGADAHEGLMIHSIFRQLQSRLATDQQFFAHLISKYLLNNNHFVRVIMTPDKELAHRELEEEQNRLQQIQNSLSNEKIEELIIQSKRLKELQDKVEDVSILPKINIQDVSKEPRDYPLHQEEHSEYTVFTHHCFTNNILYADIIFPLPTIPFDELWTLRLFILLFTQMGCGGRTYAENLEYIQAHTGGVHSGLSLNLQAHNHLDFHPSFYIQGKALNRKADQLFSLYRDLLTSVDFTDLARIKEVLFKHHTSLTTSLNQNALTYAINLSASGLTPAAKLVNDCYGLPYYHTIDHLAHHFEAKGEDLIAIMQSLQKKLLNLKGAHIVITCQEQMSQSLKKNAFFHPFVSPMQPYDPWKSDSHLLSIASQGRKIASPVAFTSKVFSTVSYTHPDAPALSAAAYLLDNTVLHRRIREQGGAYGGGACSNSASGSFYFYAYRDPNICNTLEAFETSVEELLKGKFTTSDLEEAKLEMVQSLDAPLPPGNRGKLAYSRLRKGQTEQVRQAFRHHLLALTKEEVIAASEEHIVSNMQQAAAVTFAAQELLEKENSKLTASGKAPLEILSI